MKRGVTYLVWDNYNKAELARSIESVKKQGYEVHVQVVHNTIKGLGKKSQMLDVSPFDVTLYLDTDTVVHGNLDFGFEMAQEYGLACCIAPASSCYLAEPNEMRKLIHKDLPQLNTGVIFFDKNNGMLELPGSVGFELRNWVGDYYGWGVPEVFYRWKELVGKFPESSAKNDQIAFSEAVYESLNPFILPRTWNLRRKVRYESGVIHGEIKIVHEK